MTGALSDNRPEVQRYFEEHSFVAGAVNVTSDLLLGWSFSGFNIPQTKLRPEVKYVKPQYAKNSGGMYNSADDLVATGRQATKSVGNDALNNANFAQRTYGSTFSKEGTKIYSELAGKPINTVDDLANALKNGTIKPSNVSIDYIVRDGNSLILNTRSSQALTQAGIPRSQWNAVNQTGNSLFEEMLTGQLSRNGLTPTGTPTVRLSGGVK